MNFMDGKRNVHEITKAISAEYSETTTETVLKLLHDLEKTKLVALG
jgi:formylmethanofuran dehydrogenase subunit E-like metal-binding protein